MDAIHEKRQLLYDYLQLKKNSLIKYEDLLNTNLYLVFFLFFISNLSLYSQENCQIEVGTLSSENQFICVESSIPIQNEGTFLGEQGALIYLIHSHINLLESTIVDTILIDSLSWYIHENEQISFNSQYFVSAVAGLDENSDDIPDDLNHECTKLSESMPVVWVAKVEFEHYLECDSPTGGGYIDSLCAKAVYSYVGLVINSVEGGTNQTFSISYEGFQTEVQEGGFIYLGEYLSDIQPYLSVHVQDNFGCMDTTLTIWLEECLDIIWNSDESGAYISGMPEETAIICEGEETDIHPECVIRPFGYQLKYALSTSPNYSDGNFLATITSSENFNNSHADGYLNTELFVFAFMPDFFFNIVSPSPTPVIFLSPFEVNLQIEDCNANNTTITLSPSGAYPTYNPESTNQYFISSDLFEGELALGETAMIESPNPPIEMDSILSFHISDSFGCSQNIEVENPCFTVSVPNFTPMSFQIENIYPIPTKNVLNLQVQSQMAQSVHVQLFDIGGKQISEQKHRLQSGSNHLQWNIRGIKTGMYYLRLTTNEGNMVQKIVLE